MSHSDHEKSLAAGFVGSVMKYPDRPALEADNRVFTYDSLWRLAANIAAAISKEKKVTGPTAAILGHRSVTAYAGLLGILLSGKGYLPLSPKFPLERTYRMLLLSKSDLLVVGKECFKELEALLVKLEKPLAIGFQEELLMK